VYACYWIPSVNAVIPNHSTVSVAPRMGVRIVTRLLSLQILSATFTLCVCWRHDKHQFAFRTVQMQSKKRWQFWSQNRKNGWGGNRIMRNSRWKGTRDKGRGKGEDGKRANWREDDWMIRKQHEIWINHLHVSLIRYVTVCWNVARDTGHCPIWFGTHDPHWRLLRPP